MNENKIIALLIAVALLFVHHFYKHRQDTDKTLLQKWFQWSDVNNHETVILFLLGAVVGILIS